MVKLRLGLSKRTKILTGVLPIYAFIFIFYAAFGTSDNRQIRVARDVRSAKSAFEVGGVHGSEEVIIGPSLQRHLLSTPAQNGCTPAAINEFPDDMFTQEERMKGGVIIHILISCFLFYCLAIICDDFFVPSLECICDTLDMPTDVAGATFMAMGTSAPELFTSVIGAFVTEGDIGVGTIVGSAVFNILAVLSVCGLLAGIVVPLDWWPLTRDSIAYLITVIALILIITDQTVLWWEGMIMIILYFLYIMAMFFNSRLEKLAIRVVNSCSKKPKYLVESSEHSPLLGGNKLDPPLLPKDDGSQDDNGGYTVPIKEPSEDDREEHGLNPWSMPYQGACSQVSWVLMWPANLLFWLTIPDCRKQRWRKWFMATFFMSIVYIGSLSYIIAWMVTIIGYTLGVPDSVMGLTFLAAGTSVPEAISSVIVCKQGYGNMAVSNIIGSNIFDILFCLGAPWIIKAAAFSSNNSVTINSAGIEYSAISLLSTVVFLFVAVCLNKWKLDKKLGISCLIVYILFLVVSNLFEMNVFGVVNLPTCLS